MSSAKAGDDIFSFWTPSYTIPFLFTKGLAMYRIQVTCDGVPAAIGAQAAIDITQEFQERPWHQNVACSWDGAKLLLQADNDFDLNGLALMDEFSDAIAACVEEGFDGAMKVERVITL